MIGGAKILPIFALRRNLPTGLLVVMDKIFSEDPAAGFGQRPHPVGQSPLEAVIQDGSKDDRLINDIERASRQIDLGRIPHQDFCGRRHRSFPTRVYRAMDSTK